MLADGVTESLRLKSGTKVLLSDPQQDPNQASWIVPMGCLNDLHYKLEWKDGMRTLYPKYDEKIQLELRYGCPYMERELGARLLTQMEHFQIQCELKKADLECGVATRHSWLGGQDDHGDGFDGQGEGDLPNDA